MAVAVSMAGNNAPAVNTEVLPQISNVLARKAVSLNGHWNYLVDVQEEGYYDYRMNPTPWGFFRNAKPQKPEDLIEAMMWTTAQHPVQTTLRGLEAEDESDLNDNEKMLLHLLREAEDGLLVNDIAEEVDIPYSEIITHLMTLEMKKRVKSFPGGKFRAI